MTDYYAALSELVRPISAARFPRTLEPMRHLLAALGSPERQFPAVIVTGSVGKGTAAHHLARLLSAAGLRVGLYTSPHLHSFRERFQIDGQLIEPAVFSAQACAVLAAAQDHDHSTHELSTALALRWFAEQSVEIGVLEVSIGGRFDAVNAAHGRLALITPIELEHAAMLGGTLESIAWHKAGVIQPCGAAITVPQAGSVGAVLAAEAQSVGAALLRVEDAAELVTRAYIWLRTEGSFSRLPLHSPVLEVGRLPGRLEIVANSDKTFIIDGSHTPRAAARLRAAIDAHAPHNVLIVVGMLRDKDARAYLAALDRPQAHFMLTRAPGDRALEGSELSALWSPLYARVSIQPSLEAALYGAASAEHELVVICGSLRMAAAARMALGLLPDDLRAEAIATQRLFEGEIYRAKLARWMAR
ncbi:MAG: cyanophycin synthetase [Aggregatilineales bacterium]